MLCIMLALVLNLIPVTAVQAVSYRNYITDRDAVDGSDYTYSPALAAKLNAIFDGDASIYKDKACTIPHETYLGTSTVRNNGIRRYVGSESVGTVETGTSCYIYANGVYYTLFGESTGSGEPGENSEMLNVRSTGSRRVSYENFKAWGVRQGVGALIRASGHSMIVLDYDEETLTYLDGNGDGHGLISITHEPWEKIFYTYVSYIIQPTEQHYSSLYATGNCGDNLVWAVDESGTLHLSGSGNIQYPAWNEYSDSIRNVIVHDGSIGIGNGIFYNCPNLEQIMFRSTAPTLAEDAFWGVEATVQYPATQKGWHGDLLLDYGGMLTWQPHDMTELEITGQPNIVYSQEGTATVTVEAEGDGLTYVWYTKAAPEEPYVKSSFTGPVYSALQNEMTKDLQVQCVITDRYGNFVTSESVLLWPHASAMDPCCQ